MTTDQDPSALAREALNLCSTGPQPGELTTIGEYDQSTEWSSTRLRWRHIRNGEAVKEDFARFDDDEQYDEDAPKGHSTEADFHIFARDNLATLARSVLALTEERDRMRGLLTEARDALTPLSEYELPIMLLNRIDAALRGKETTDGTV